MEEWKKVESEVVRFENEGDAVEGKLVSREIGAEYGNEVYRLKTEDGEKVVFGTSVLMSKMRGIETGTDVKIVFTGYKPTKKRGQSDIKLFEVYTR